MDGDIIEVRKKMDQSAVHPGSNSSLCLLRPEETEKQQNHQVNGSENRAQSTEESATGVAYFLGMWTTDSHSSSHSAKDPQAAWAGLLLAPGLAYR